MFEVLQLCNCCGQAARATAGHAKQPHRPNVARGPQVGQPWYNGTLHYKTVWHLVTFD